jgi:alkaline phosphatase D
MTLYSSVLRGALALALAAAALQPARAVITVHSNFDENLEGWSVTGGGATPAWKTADAGADGGYAESSDAQDGVFWYWSAPSKFLGDRRTAHGQNLRFRIWESDTGTDSGGTVPDVILKGDNTTLVMDLPPFAPGVWTDVSVRLAEDAGWKLGNLSGPAPDTNTMLKVLANLISLEIRGEYRSGPDTGRLDSVVLEMSALPQPADLPITSDLNRNDEGWTVYGDAQGGSSKPTWRATGGTGNGAYVEATDNVQGGVWYWSAPPNFLGNLSSALGRTLTFHLRQSATTNQFTAADVILEGGGHRLIFMNRYHPATTWTMYSVPLRAQSGWHVDTIDGRMPTSDEFRETLTFLEALQIRGEYITGADTDGLDTVALGAPALIPGDADLDLQVSMTDAITCLRIAGGLQSGSYARILGGDVAPAANGNYGDGILDILDAVRIVRHLAGKEPLWP